MKGKFLLIFLLQNLNGLSEFDQEFINRIQEIEEKIQILTTQIQISKNNQAEKFEMVMDKLSDKMHVFQQNFKKYQIEKLQKKFGIQIDGGSSPDLKAIQEQRNQAREQKKQLEQEQEKNRLDKVEQEKIKLEQTIKQAEQKALNDIEEKEIIQREQFKQKQNQENEDYQKKLQKLQDEEKIKEEKLNKLLLTEKEQMGALNKLIQKTKKNKNSTMQELLNYNKGLKQQVYQEPKFNELPKKKKKNNHYYSQRKKEFQNIENQSQSLPITEDQLHEQINNSIRDTLSKLLPHLKKKLQNNFIQIIIMEQQISYTSVFFDVLRTTVGKDKYCRFMQYGSNSSAEILKQNKILNSKDDIYLALRNTGNAFSMARKVLRFGKHQKLFEGFQANIQNLKINKVKKNWRKYFYYLMKCCSQFTYFLYLITDHYIYFEKFIQKNPKFLNFNIWINDVFWFVQECFDFITNTMDFFESLKKNYQQKTIKNIILKIQMNILNALAALGFFSDIFSRLFNVSMGFITTLIWWHVYFSNKINQVSLHYQDFIRVLFFLQYTYLFQHVLSIPNHLLYYTKFSGQANISYQLVSLFFLPKYSKFLESNFLPSNSLPRIQFSK